MPHPRPQRIKACLAARILTADRLGLRAIDKFRSRRTSTLLHPTRRHWRGVCRTHVHKCAGLVGSPDARRVAMPPKMTPGSLRDLMNEFEEFEEFVFIFISLSTSVIGNDVSRSLSWGAVPPPSPAWDCAPRSTRPAQLAEGLDQRAIAFLLLRRHLVIGAHPMTQMRQVPTPTLTPCYGTVPVRGTTLFETAPFDFSAPFSTDPRSGSTCATRRASSASGLILTLTADGFPNRDVRRGVVFRIERRGRNFLRAGSLGSRSFPVRAVVTRPANRHSPRPSTRAAPSA
jgi:hypothetical protein